MASILAALKLTDVVQASKYGYFKRLPDMNVARAGHKSFLLSDGRVLIIGGDKYNNDKNIILPEDRNCTAEIYDPKTNMFSFIKNLKNEIKPDSNVVLIRKDRLLITGGYSILKRKTNVIKTENTAYIYDFKSNKIIKLPNMNIPRMSHSSVVLNDGRVLILGGCHNSYNGPIPNNQAEIYDPQLNKFILLKNSPKYIHGQNTNTAILNTGEVFIVNHSLKQGQEAEIFDPKTSTFSVLSGKIYTDLKLRNINFNYKKYYIDNIELLKDDKIIIFGNYDYLFNNIAVFDLHTKKLKNIGSMNIKKRHSYEVTLLKDGNILISNGYVGRANLIKLVGSAELFDTKKMRFYKLPYKQEKKFFASAILLKNGNVLITGGRVYNSVYLRNSIIFNYSP